MTFTSVGYAGSVGWADWAAIAKNQGADYSVAAAGDLAVTIADASAGTVRVADGTASGRGITDTMDDAETILTGLTTADTWYTVVLRRDWTPGTGSEVTSLVALAGGASQAIAASRQSTIGSTDDQPLALVHRGGAALDAVVDLRCWWGNGGMWAASTDALAYLGRDGSVVHVGSSRWERLPGSSGWTREPLDMDRATAGTLAIARGGTGATTATAARTALGITPTAIGAAPAWPSRSIRYVTFTRSDEGTFGAGSMVQIAAASMPSNAPTGLWLIMWTAYVEASQETTAFLRGLAGTTNITAPDQKFRAPGTLTLPTWYQHAGGSVALRMYVQISAGTGTAPAGSRINAVWMGP